MNPEFHLNCPFCGSQIVVPKDASYSCVMEHNRLFSEHKSDCFRAKTLLLLNNIQMTLQTLDKTIYENS